MRQNNKKIITPNFALQLKGKKFRKKTKLHLLVIWIETIPLLQVHFIHFIAKQDTIFKDICSSGVIYYGPGRWSFKRQIPYVNIIIIIYYEVFLYFFPNQFFKKSIFLRSGVRKSGGISWKVFSYKWYSARFS